MKNKIITISGLDGAGKSSIISGTIQLAQENNIPLITKWCSYELILLRPFIRLAQKIYLRKTDQFKDFKGYSASINHLSENKLLSKTYEYFTLIEYILQIFFKIALPRYFSKKSILCDRYYYDVLVSLAVTLSYPDEKFKRKVRFYSHFFPRPDISFFLDIDENVAFSRKKDIPSVDYLKQRKKYYLTLMNILPIRVLNGESPVQLNAEYIFKKLIGDGA